MESQHRLRHQSDIQSNCDQYKFLFTESAAEARIAFCPRSTVDRELPRQSQSDR
jgi:hypothetical protein